jgi:hypothetical protein
MNARTIEMVSDLRSAEGEASGLRLRGPGSTPPFLLSANSDVDALPSFDDSQKPPDDLLRRFDTANPSPWRHGGLNE